MFAAIVAAAAVVPLSLGVVPAREETCPGTESHSSPLVNANGGITATMKLCKMFIENGVAGIHIEDQKPGKASII